MSETAAVKQQRAADENMLGLSRKYKQVFSGPAGEEVLEHIFVALCRVRGQLPADMGRAAPSPDAALYWGGRGDVGRAIQAIMEYDPQSAEVVVKRKRDGQ